ncbi:hypothetical protein IM660_01470 [Ruania alkalisoli]|uniref:HTH luxR-type domain-containing protein n=1 Tax=Ruania alkalisoli TaxID=2779775 RepID=A0A7M1SWK6_9MICO|nr:LuxR C-terminal-related transcriptional regulator [Ruania alkalisoli]QOR71013.1 hypothetical protein IM660_01470 [Ruania alkalisoli]
MTEAGHGALRRSSLVSTFEQLGPGSVVMISGPYGSGRGTLVRQWLAEQGLDSVWWNTARTLPRITEEEKETSADVVVVRLHDGGTHDVESILACRARWPEAILAVISPYGWPDGLRSGPLRPEVVVSAHDLAFSADEVASWASDLGVTVSATQTASIIDATGGYAVVVDAVVRRAAVEGGYSPDTLARGCDEAVSDLSAAASGGVVPWDLWEVSLLTAFGGSLAPVVIETLWARARQGPAALRVMRDSGVIADVADGRLGLAPGIRAACRRRFGTDLPHDRHWQILHPLLDRWAAAGHLDDATTLMGTTDLDGARTQLMARHWTRLAELPAPAVRERLANIGPHSDPHLLVALSRAMIDVSHPGHPGEISVRDRERAGALLAEATATGGLDVPAVAMATALHAVVLRARGRHDDAYALHEHTVDDPGHVASAQAGVTLQAGLSAMSVGALPRAGEHFGAAAQHANEAGQPPVAAMATELEELVYILGADPAQWWRRTRLQTATSSGWHKVTRLVRLVRAVRTVDVAAMLEARADDTEAATVDDPVVIDLFAWCFQAMALTLLDRPHVALTHTQVLQTALADGELSAFEQRMLVVARAEALSASGDPAAALELLAEHYGEPDHRYDVELLRARAEIDSGEYAAALTRIERTIAGHDGHLGRHTAWGHVLLAIAHRGVGSARESDRVLESALAAAARNGQRQPFARQGLDEFGRLIAQGQRLALDPVTHQFLTELMSTRDMLRAVTAPVTLTTRERLLLERLVRTEGVRRLAGELHVSPNTVKSQLRTLYRKLDVSSRAEAIRVAQAMRLVPLT